MDVREASNPNLDSDLHITDWYHTQRSSVAMYSLLNNVEWLRVDSEIRNKFLGRWNCPRTVESYLVEEHVSALSDAWDSLSHVCQRIQKLGCLPSCLLEQMLKAKEYVSLSTNNCPRVNPFLLTI